MAAQQTCDGVVRWSLQGLVLMVQGRVPLQELGGPIAIAQAAGQQAQRGLRATSSPCSRSCRSTSAC